MKRDQIEPPPEKTTFKKTSLIKVKHLIFIFYGSHDNRYLVQSIYSIRKTFKIEKTLTFFFWTHFQAVISKKYPWSLHSLRQVVFINKKQFFLIAQQLLLICVYNGRTLEYKINRLHERFFRIIYSDKHLYFRYFLDRNRSVSINTCNLQILAVKDVVPTVFGNNLISMPLANLSTCCQSRFRLNLSKIDIWWNQINRSSRYQNLGFSFKK